MRIVFIGTSSFAVPSLHALAKAGHSIVGVVSQPDRPHGRGLKMAMSPVKEAALACVPDAPILQPERARTREFREAVAALKPDVLVVAAFGQILSQRVLSLPRFGGVNVHGSLLPRWRGAAPIQYSIISGDARSGVTTMQMDAGLDTGDMLLQKSIPIEPHDTAGTLEQRLADLGASLVVETLALLDNGDCPRAPQRPELATYAPSLPPDAGKIDWCARAAIIDCLIRGTTPRPGAFTTLAGKRLKIWEADLVPDATGGAKPGELLDKSQTGIMVATGDYSMCVRAVQPEGKARMSAADWARGARIAIGTRFEN